ncbi:MAG: hypothetical protein HRT35_22395 [Algicola sp.]|nr:hypothetical protein [Algicola sp.]
MKKMLLSLFALLSTTAQDAGGEGATKQTYFTWDDFAVGYSAELVAADDVYNTMIKNGLKDNLLAKFDFEFISDSKEKLAQLQTFVEQHYPYKITTIKKRSRGLWVLEGETDEIPVTAANLLFWAMDMYKRGHKFDARLDGYGALMDPKDPRFPDFSSDKEDHYFNKGVDSYNQGNLSGAIINWSNVLVINPKDSNALYSRAIVKDELYAWKAALKDYNKAIEITPDFVSAIINRGSLKDEHDDHQGAIADYNTVLSIKNVELDSQQQAYFNRGNAKLNLKDKTGACEDWKKAQALGADYATERLTEYCQ